MLKPIERAKIRLKYFNLVADSFFFSYSGAKESLFVRELDRGNE